MQFLIFILSGIGAVLSYIGLKFCWIFGFIGFGYNLYLGTTILASLGLGICWLLTALLCGLIGLAICFIITLITVVTVT